MILSDTKILESFNNSSITIEPFNENQLGSNSYDVTLNKWLKVYKSDLDLKGNNETLDLEIPDDGLVLQPNTLYLGVTNEKVGSSEYLPMLHGRSSIGRLGIAIHITAGFGDVGFIGYWTLEIQVTQPVRIYPNVKIGQIAFHKVDGEVKNTYDKKMSAKYNNQPKEPIASMFLKNEI